MGFLPHNPQSERETNLLLGGIIVAAIIVLVAAIFTSPWIIVGAALFGIAVFAAWREPMWVVLALAAWWPLEPFLLKFVSDDLYVYARFASEVMVYVLVAVVVIGMLYGRYHRRSTPADLPFLIFLILMIASIVLNTLPVTEAALGLRQIIRFMFLFWVIVIRYPRRFWIKRLIWVLFAIALLQSVLGVAQAVVGGSFDSFLLPSERRTLGEIQLTEGTTQFWDPGQRVFGTMGRYDRLGTFLALVLLIVVGMVYEGNRKHDWRGLGMLAVIALPALILTYSRSSWFGLMFGGLAIAAIKRDKRVFAAAGVVLVLFAGYLGINGLSSSLSDVPRQTVAERFFEAFTYQRFRGEYMGLGRVYWIAKTPTEIVPHSVISFLFGWGPGQYGAGAVAALGNTRVYDAVGLPFGVYGSEGYIDNNWFALWGEAGTLGIIFYLWGYIALMVAAFKIARSSKTSLTRAVASAYFGISIAVAINAALATFLEVRTLAPYLWMMAGCMVVLGSREKLIDTRVRR